MWDVYQVFWLALMIVLILAEVVTVNVVSLWFALGAFAALICAFFGLDIIVQSVVFIIVSALTLYFTRPIVQKFLKVGKSKTNVDAVIGARGVVIKPVFPNEFGQVKIGGQIWTAKAAGEHDVIGLHEEVEVVAIEGVKAVVRRI